MTRTDCFVSVVVPLHDDGDIIVPFVEEVSALLAGRFSHHEIVLVDAASSDDTVEKLSALLGRIDFVRLIRLSRDSGREIPILAGLESVIGDYVVVMLPDSDPPGLIPEMVERARGGAGIVSGVRESMDDMSPLMRLGAPVFYWYVNHILQLGLPEHTTEFRLLTRPVVNGVVRTRDLMRYLRLYNAYAGVPHETLPYEPGSRRGRPRRRSWREVLQRSAGIIVANSTHPLRLVSLLGLVASGLNVLYAVYVLVVYLFKADVAPGWATQSLQTAGMFFLLFLILAVLCEYVIRILDERTERPSYYVMEELQSGRLLDEDGRRNIVGDVTGPGGGEA